MKHRVSNILPIKNLDFQNNGQQKGWFFVGLIGLIFPRSVRVCITLGIAGEVHIITSLACVQNMSLTLSHSHTHTQSRTPHLYSFFCLYLRSSVICNVKTITENDYPTEETNDAAKLYSNKIKMQIKLSTKNSTSGGSREQCMK